MPYSTWFVLTTYVFLLLIVDPFIYFNIYLFIYLFVYLFTLFYLSRFAWQTHTRTRTTNHSKSHIYISKAYTAVNP